MSLLSKMLLKRLFPVMLTSCASILTAIVTLWWNTQLTGIINTISIGGILSDKVIILAIATMLVISIANYAKGYISGYTCEIMAHDIRLGYARYFTSLPIIEIERLSVGEQLSKLQNEIAEVSVYMNNNMFQLLDDCVRFASTLVWLLLLNPGLTMAAYLPLLVIVTYVFYSSKIIGAATEISQQTKGRMNSYADTLLTLFPIIRLYDASSIILNGYKAELKSWENHTVQAERIRARLMSLSALLSCIPLILLFWVGGRMTVNGLMAIGTLYVFFNLSGNVSGVMMNMPGHIAAFRQFSAGMKRVSPHVSDM